MKEQTGGDLLADALIAQGVETVFGIPGVQLDAAADALYARSDRIDFVCARNEQATTYMADGYARSTGEVGVAMVVPGPGVLNALSGIATGYSANSPTLLIAGQIDSGAIGKGLGALHEIPDQTGILARLTKWTGIARSADEVPGLVDEAFRQLRSGRPRPVALEVPPDVLAAYSNAPVAGFRAPAPLRPDQSEVAAIAARLRAAERPMIVVGGGVIASGATARLVELAEALEAPVLMTENGRGAIDARHRLAFDSLALPRLQGGCRSRTGDRDPLRVDLRHPGRHQRCPRHPRECRGGRPGRATRRRPDAPGRRPPRGRSHRSRTRTPRPLVAGERVRPRSELARRAVRRHRTAARVPRGHPRRSAGGTACS